MKNNNHIYYSTVVPLLREVLEQLMSAELFNPFRLVGGTSLSLQLGHRMSDDIDLFTDHIYGSIDFKKIDGYMKRSFSHCSGDGVERVGFGRSYNVGHSADKLVKVDVYYTDEFIRPAMLENTLRLATLEEIIAMKMEILPRGGRMKDFWDLHELTNHFTLKEMIALHKERYPYSHDAKELKKGFTDFTRAEKDFTPVCLRGKHWETIKLDLLEFAAK